VEIISRGKCAAQSAARLREPGNWEIPEKLRENLPLVTKVLFVTRKPESSAFTLKPQENF